MALSPSTWPLLYRTAPTSSLCFFSFCLLELFFLEGRRRFEVFFPSLRMALGMIMSAELSASTISEAQRTKGTLPMRVSVFGTV